MEGFGKTDNSKLREPWTTDMMRENRSKWNLAADIGALEYLQQFGDKLLNETENTLNLLDSFETELNTSCVQVSNITNRFLSLADSQFVENRVYDDEETPTPETAGAVPSVPVKTKQEIEAEIFSRLKESVNNGLNVLNTKFEAVEVANSDSEDDDSGPMGIVYKPINQFNYRPLPHLIGSTEFMKDPTLGLEELQSDDEESVEEESSSEGKELTEENEDSEPESDRLNIKMPTDVKNIEPDDLLFKHTTSHFADHLAKRLQNIENESRIPNQSSRNLFSTTPPPLDDSYDDDFCSNDDLIFGGNNKEYFCDNEDIFAPKSKTSLWDDNKNDIINGTESMKENDNNRKKIMHDLEKRFSQNFKSNDDNNLYDDVSPSPPPLNDDINHENYGNLESKESSSLFGNNHESNDESDDLFGVSSKNESAVCIKKKIYPGSVNVFGANTNVFKDTAKQQGENHKSSFKSSVNENLIKTDNDIISKTISSIRRNHDDEDEEEDDDLIFKSSNQLEKSSSRSSSVKLSESFQDDNISIQSNKSAGLFDDILTNTKKNSIKKTMDDLFSDLNNGGDDDLFSSNFSSKGGKTDSSLFDGPSNNTNLFSSDLENTSGNKNNDLFGDTKGDLFSSFTNQKRSVSRGDKTESSNVVINKNSGTKILNKPISLFDDEEDDTDIFGSDFLTSKVSSASNSKKVEENKKPEPSVNETKGNSSYTFSSILGTSIKNSTKGRGLFGDEDDDLFNVTSGNDQNLFISDAFTKYPSAVSEINSKEKFGVVTDTAGKPNDKDLFSDVKSFNKNAVLQSSEKILHESNSTDEGNKSFVRENECVNNSKQKQSTLEVGLNKDVKPASVKSLSLFSEEISDDLFGGNEIYRKNISNDYNNTKTSSNEEQLNVCTSNVESLSKNSTIKHNKKIESNNDVSKKSSSNVLFDKDEPLNGYDDKINDFLDQETCVPPLPDSDVDDSPLFSDDKNNYVSFVGNSKDDLFKNPGDNVKRDITQKFPSKDSSDDVDLLNSNSVLKETESDDLLFKNTATPVPLSSNDDLFPSESNLIGEVIIPPFDENDNDSVDKISNVASKKVTDFDNISRNTFNTNHSLPKIPSDSIEKPQISFKRQPPKSLNISAPISSPSLFGDNSSNVSSTKSSLDVPDGSTFSSESSTLPSPKITPGKLNLEKSLNINPKALLPGARPVSFKKSSSPPAVRDDQLKDSPKEIFSSDSSGLNSNRLKLDLKEHKIISGSSSSLPNTDSEPVLQSIAKDRAKIQVKRRPQSRKARQEAIRQSTIENNNDDDETDYSSSVTTQSNKEPKSTSSSIFDQPSNILSPSTDEEDLFGVPPLDLPPDYTKVSVSPGDVFDTPVIISSDLNSANSSDNKPINVSPNENVENSVKRDNPEDIFKSSSRNDSATLINSLKTKDNSSNFFNDSVDESKDKLSSTNDNNLMGNEISNNPPNNDLFSDIDDSDVFMKKTQKSYENSDDIISNDSDLFSSYTDRQGRTSDEIIANESNLLGNKFDKSKKKLNISNHADLFSTKSDEVEEISNDSVSNDLRKSDGSSNIICGVFNTGVNICDKLSVTPLDGDEIFSPSDWTLSNRKDNTIVSVPEKIKTDSLFVDDKQDSNDDDSLFFASKSSSIASKGNLDIPKKEDNVGNKNKTKLLDNLFSNDDGESDLFGEIKLKKDRPTVSKLAVSSVQKFSDMSSSKDNKPTIKNKSLFGDDDDDDGDDIFGSSIKSKLSSQTNSVFDETKKPLGNSSGAVTKKSSSLRKPIKLSSAKEKQDEEFIDPLAALGNKD